MKNKKLSIDLSYPTFACLSILTLAAYEIIPKTKVEIFSVGVFALISVTNVLILMSCLAMIAALRNNKLVTVSEVPKERKTNPIQMYVWTILESSFVLAISFSPAAQDYRWIVYLFAAKWVLMLIANTAKIKLLEKMNRTE